MKEAPIPVGVNDETEPEVIRLEEKDGQLCLHLQGTVNAFYAEQLHAAALEAAGKSLPVSGELGRVEGLDASALQLLLALDRTLKDSGRRLVLRSSSAAVDGLLASLGLAEVFVREIARQG